MVGLKIEGDPPPTKFYLLKKEYELKFFNKRTNFIIFKNSTRRHFESLERCYNISPLGIFIPLCDENRFEKSD